MRAMLLPGLAVLLLTPIRLAGADDAKAIIEKAIEAHGGEAKLAKLKMVSSKAKGTINLGFDMPFVLETIWQWPDRLKNVLKLESDPTSTIVETVAGRESWSTRGGRPAYLDSVKRDELRTQAYVRRLLLLTPLLHDSSYELSTLEEIHVHDRPARGVRVKCEGERNVRLYFDVDTGRLAKVELRVYDEAAKKTIVREGFLSDYQDVDGVPTAKKQVWRRDGKKALEMTLSEVHYVDHLDAGSFVDLRPYRRQRDVIYGHKSGLALTMDVFTPKKGANGAAVVSIASGGWLSDPAMIDSGLFPYFIDEPVKHGYTVFAVCHGSQPRFTIPDAIADVNRAVRYIRYHARDFGIDPRRIGATGGSSGGHLALMLGVAGDNGDQRSTDAVERTSSRVQAVACLVPPTDFLNYGGKGRFAFAENGVLGNYRAAIDVRELDKHSNRLERLDEKKFEALCRRISPLSHVSGDDPPTLIIQGDSDRLVPLQQAQVMVERLTKAGVEAKLIVKKGANHIWGGMDKDVATAVEWFDKHLKK